MIVGQVYTSGNEIRKPPKAHTQARNVSTPCLCHCTSSKQQSKVTSSLCTTKRRSGRPLDTSRTRAGNHQRHTSSVCICWTHPRCAVYVHTPHKMRPLEAVGGERALFASPCNGGRNTLGNVCVTSTRARESRECRPKSRRAALTTLNQPLGSKNTHDAI